MKKNDLIQVNLYKHLIKKAKELGISAPASHPMLFNVTEETSKHYQALYLNQRGSTGKLLGRPGKELCKNCFSFHINELKEIDKKGDLNFGKKLEECFQQYVQEMLNHLLKIKGYSDISVRCERADTGNYHMPDFRLVRENDGKILAYFEFKSIFRPFLSISKKVDSNYKCYSHSLTLDIGSNEEKQKLKEQRVLVEGVLAANIVDYVYWYDIPCVKGVFSISSSSVYNLMDTQQIYTRKETDGDYNDKGTKVGSIDKIYIPLVQMNDIKNLLIKYITLAIAP